MVWPDGPKVDRGPIIVATEEPLEVAGQQTKLVTTRVFFGSDQEALVIHLRQGEARYLVSAKGLSVKTFKDILKTLELSRK